MSTKSATKSVAADLALVSSVTPNDAPTAPKAATLDPSTRLAHGVTFGVLRSAIERAGNPGTDTNARQMGSRIAKILNTALPSSPVPCENVKGRTYWTTDEVQRAAKDAGVTLI